MSSSNEKPRPQAQKTAIIVGAGAGGIASAARLAHAGYKVTVYEANSFTGGRCSLIHHDGWRFDQGPSLLLLPELFHETFADLGTTIAAEGVELLKCEPNYNIHFHDGEMVSVSSDTAVMRDVLRKYEGDDGFDRYLAWMRESHFHYSVSVREVLSKSFPKYWDILRWSFVKYLIPLHPLESLYSRAARYFRTERLRRVFTFASMYMGMSPFDAPGVYSLLQYTELAEGIWYPKGGFQTILAAIQRIAERKGATFHLSSPVKSIRLDLEGRVATGIELQDGTSHSADVVLVNADLVWSYNNLLPKSLYASRLARRTTSCSSISFYWAIDRKIPQLSTHNIFLAEQYRESFDRIFKDYSMPDEPSFYVNVPSRIDPSAAPEGCDSLVVLVPCAHLIDPSPNSSSPSPSRHGKTAQDVPAMVELTRKMVLEVLKLRTGVDLQPHIVHESYNDPNSWQSKFNLDRGAILGLSHDFFNVLIFRPQAAHSSIDGLYFVGASSHPGTGVPIVLKGAELATDQILGREHRVRAERGIDELYEKGMIKGDGGKVRRLDVIRPGSWSWVNVMLWILAVLVVMGSVILARAEVKRRFAGYTLQIQL